jgi:rhomboid protease GluP
MARSPHAVLCSRCRQLISPDERNCPYCGAIAPGRFGNLAGLARLLDAEWSDILLYACIALYVCCLVRDRVLGLPMGGALEFFNPSSGSLYLLGMTGGYAWVQGAWWTVLTSTLLHGGALHLYFNMSFLRVLGPLVRDVFGPQALLLIFFGTGAIGALASNLISGYPTIGASGGLFGMMGAILGFGWRRGGVYGRRLSSAAWGWAAPNLLIGCLLPFVNNTAHVGGLLSGIVLGLLLPPSERRTPIWVSVVGFVLLAITVGGIAASLLTMGDVAASVDPA